MPVLAAQVSDGLVTTFVAVFLTSAVAFATWLVKELFNVSKVLAALVERVDAHDDKLAETLNDTHRRNAQAKENP